MHYLSQVITSPGYGSSNYPLGVHCDWVLDGGARNTRIQVKITEMNLEDSPDCSKDSLNIEDIGRRSSVNQDESGAVILSSLSENLLDYYWRSV